MEFENDLVCSIAEFIRSENSENNILNEDMEKDDKMTVVGTRSTANADGIQIREHSEDLECTVGTSEHREITSLPVVQRRKRVRFVLPESPKTDTGAKEELAELMEARESGIAYILGNTYMRAKPGSSITKRFAIDYGYEFLRRNSRAATYALNIPHASTLEVGMIYHV